jgi:hypothetical protein
MKIKYIDKSPPSDVKVQNIEFTTDHIPFYHTRAELLSDQTFVLAESMSRLTRSLGTIQDMGDILTQDQADYIEGLFDVFKQEIGLAEAEKRVTALRMENGRLRSKLKKQEKANEGV